MSSPIRIARQLRQQMTLPETILWEILRRHGLKTKKFRRQHPIIYAVEGWKKYFYVADFYCASRKLVIELDGKYHEFHEQKEYDKARDRIMNDMQLKILRITNDELLDDIESVLKKIEEAL